MRISIQTPGFTPAKKLTNYIISTVSRVSDFADRIIETQVVLKISKSDKLENKVCELKVVIPGNDLFAEKKGRRFEGAISDCVDAIEHQIRRWKGSTDSARNRGASKSVPSGNEA